MNYSPARAAKLRVVGNEFSSEERRAGAGTPVPESKGSPSARTAANSEKRWPIGAGMAFCMGSGALAYVAMFWVLFG